MSQNSVFKTTLNIALIAALIACGICCTEDEWECESGECIKSDSLCDGAIDCKDKSDETADSCIQQTCPTFSFQCAYGACVHGAAKCNNIKDCADNSDETFSLCKGGESKGTTSNCLDEEFKCASNECIGQDNVCDGRADCQDKSDESVDTCASNECPSFAFRCGYGACIRTDKTCDGHMDCIDGSDEARGLCGYTNKTRPSPGRPDSPPPVNPPTTVIGCMAPSIPNSRVVYEADSSKVVVPGVVVPNLVSITYGCEPGYTIPQGGSTYNFCQDTEWLISPHPECVKTNVPGIQSGCTAPIIANSKLLYEFEPKRVIAPGGMVPDGVSIEYECMPKYSRVGQSSNFCRNSKWIGPHPQCIKFCDANKLRGITFKADCRKDGVSVSCEKSIEPGTIAEISCNVQYRPQESSFYNTLTCGDDGIWDYLPQACLPECGRNAPKIKGFIAGGDPTDITQVPWHVGIYDNFSGQYRHICGGTIISAGVVISAAHCFWDKANRKIYGNSYYAIGAGKYFRDYYKSENYSQYQNISEIHAHKDFKDEDSSYKFDIAVLILTNFLRLSPFVAPACLKWEDGAQQIIKSNVTGKVAGWGLLESGDYSIDLRTATASTSSYDECTNEFSTKWPYTITTDKFCVINRFGTTVCRGDSGGGFIVEAYPNDIARKKRHYLWGIVSGGVPYYSKCSETEFVTYTNIQFYGTFIRNLLESKKPK